MNQHPREQRRRLILDRARSDGRVQVTELATVLDVAAETVRRDLAVLEDDGFLRRTHGGALPIDSAGLTARLAQPSAQSVAEHRIAMAALSVLDTCESLFIDDGSTTMTVAELLLTVNRPLTVVTSSIVVAATLAPRPKTDVLMLGGTMRGASMATTGPCAIAMLSRLTVDMSIMSAKGISIERGVSATDTGAADLKRAAIRAARKRIFVGPHTTFGISSLCRFGGVQDFDAVITDAGLPSAVATRYKAAGTRLIRA